MDKVLLVKRANPPGEGHWSVSGGVIELGETMRDAAKWVLREECGMEIIVDGALDVRATAYERAE